MSVSRRHLSDSIHRYQGGAFQHQQWSNGGERSLVRAQLALEHKLQAVCKELLHHYKEGQNWEAVGQVAHNLVTGTRRITHLEEQLSGGCVRPLLRSISEVEEAEDARTPSPSPGRSTEDAVGDSVKDTSDPFDDKEDSAFSEKSEEEMSNESTSEDLPKPMASPGLTGVTLTVGVSEVVDPDSGETAYLVDTRVASEDTPCTECSVVHQRKDFECLRSDLAAVSTAKEVAELPSLEDSVEPEKLLELLSAVVQSPVLRSHPNLMKFLGVEVPIHSFADEVSQTLKGLCLLTRVCNRNKTAL